LHLVLFQPEIPPNTGNIMRLCANTNTSLHLVRPLGFEMDDRQLRRAGLDYREWAEVEVHDSLGAFATGHQGRIIAFTRNAGTPFGDLDYRETDALLFGPESDGLPDEVLNSPFIDVTARIPMVPRSRSLNLANAAAIALYEALRQQGYPHLE
jgi:tRNA (cytidine/uridine-2'-O-)-methyltransferase